MNIEFNTVNDVNRNALNGWFDGFCPSNGIADKNNKKVKSTLAEKGEWDKRYTALKNGQQASEWAELKKEVARTQQLIDEETQKLNQEKGIADALGLGAWCNGAVSRRKKSEAALSSAQKALGLIKGSYQTLERQQKEGITRASEVIESNKKTLEVLKQQLAAVKQKIAAYKAQRDAEKIAKEKAAIEAANSKKISQAGFLNKENMPLVIGGVLLAGTALYFSNKKKGKSNIKKVQA